MRGILYLALIAACELRPAPKPQPAPPAATPAAQVDQTGQADGAGAPAGSAARAAVTEVGEVSDACLEVATRIVQVFIDNATDAGQKSVYEQARTTMVRKTAETCTKQGWSEQTRGCYAAATTPDAIKACEIRAAPPPSAPSPPAADVE